MREACEGKDPVDIYNKVLAGLCKRLICIDDDGYPMVDYLCDDMMEYLRTSGREAFVADAFKFIVDQSNIWKELKDCKKAFRYTLLRNYFEGRQGVPAAN